MPVPDALQAQFDQLKQANEARRDEALKALEPQYAKRDALVAQIQPLEQQLRELQKQIKEQEAPLRDAGNTLATIARAQGARSLTNEGPAAAAEPRPGG